MTSKNTNNSLCCVSSGCCVSCSFLGGSSPASHSFLTLMAWSVLSWRHEWGRSVELSSWAAPSPLLLCPPNFCCLGSVDFHSVSLAPGTRHHLASSSCSKAKASLDRKLGQSKAYFSGRLSCTACWATSEIHYFIYFVQCFSCLVWEGKSLLILQLV